jgi:hypothetical protein
MFADEAIKICMDSAAEQFILKITQTHITSTESEVSSYKNGDKQEFCAGNCSFC